MGFECERTQWYVEMSPASSPPGGGLKWECSRPPKTRVAAEKFREEASTGEGRIISWVQGDNKGRNQQSMGQDSDLPTAFAVYLTVLLDHRHARAFTLDCCWFPALLAELWHCKRDHSYFRSLQTILKLWVYSMKYMHSIFNFQNLSWQNQLIFLIPFVWTLCRTLMYATQTKICATWSFAKNMR